MEDKIKNFDEFKNKNNLDSFIDEDIHIKMSEFEYIDEGILQTIKQSGFWKSIKRFGTKVGSRISAYIRDDKELQQAISGAIKSGGQGVMDDIGLIFTNFDDKLQAAEKRAQEAEAELRKEKQKKD